MTSADALTKERENRRREPLVLWYAGLAIVATVASLQAILFPRWPRAAALHGEPIRNALAAAGFAPEPQQSLAPERSQELATSEVLGYRLNDGAHLRLMRANVRQFRSFQTAFIVRDRPELHLRERRLASDPPTFAVGAIGGLPSRQICLVPGHPGQAGFGTTNDELTALAATTASSPSATLRRLVGLLPNRTYECVLISLTGREGESVSPTTWRRLLTTLDPALQPEAQRTPRP